MSRDLVLLSVSQDPTIFCQNLRINGGNIAVYRDVAGNVSIIDNGDGTFTVSSRLDETDTLTNVEV